LRIGGGDVEVALVIGDGLLRSVLEIAGGLGALAHRLDGVHNIVGLVVVGVAEFGGPGKIAVEFSENLGEGGEGFDAGIPGLGIGSRGDLIGRGVGHGLTPVVGGGDLLGKGRGGENLGDEGVGVEGYGGNELVELVGG